MKYLAHRSEDEKREQTNREHLEETAELAKQFAEEFGYGDWGYCEGLLHDIGKYSEAFQQRIRGDRRSVDHATAGAQLCWQKGGAYAFLSYCIAGHHAGLPDTGEKGDADDRRTLMGRLKKKIENYQAYEAEIEIPKMITPPFQVANREMVTFTTSIFIRMLYSCLVDADFLDTESFMKDGNIDRISGDSMAHLRKKCLQHISGWLSNQDNDSVNGRRTEILRNCLNMGEREKGLYRLTVPTGGGKTIASLAFALTHAVKNKMCRVIYVIPYTSIIEQNAQVFREILGNENVLESHSNVNYNCDGEELNSSLLAAENWDKPVVVTTNVQFFESLFASKPSKCRKLHNIANSVIIFDEAQMLPNDYLKPCVVMIEELIKHYRCSAVLCTATQPALQSFFSLQAPAIELCPRMEEQFRFFKRVAIENMGIIEEEQLIDALRKERQALCILNRKKSVRKIYQELRGEGVFHLSTNMYPIHRRQIVAKIRKRLENSQSCIVISTSLVEAGVDLDFQAVYREVAGIDSMIQAAGRCNREGKRKIEESMIHIFQFQQEKPVPEQATQIASAGIVMEGTEDIFSQEAIQKYFQYLYHFKGESLDKKDILGKFRKGRMPFATVGEEFRIIEQRTKSIYIPREMRAKELLEEIRQKGATRALIREAGQYSISVYDNDFQRLYHGGAVAEISEDLKEDFFVLCQPEMYTEDMGLSTEIEQGILMFI